MGFALEIISHTYALTCIYTTFLFLLLDYNVDDMQVGKAVLVSLSLLGFAETLAKKLRLDPADGGWEVCVHLWWWCVCTLVCECEPKILNHV